uniref:SAP domain-containing protein n=1 Tax=Arcella intermedia TaxID=1963864 RepID=A0A6B2L9P3_9EUKA
MMKEREGESNVTKKMEKSVLHYFTELIRELGLRRVFQDIHVDILVSIYNICKDDKSDKKRAPKPVMAECVTEYIKKKGITSEQFIEDLDAKIRNDIFKDCEIPIDENSVDAWHAFVDRTGLITFFASLPDSKLRKFAEKCRLTLKTQSREKMIDAILKQEDYDPKKPKPKVEKPSKHKPKIKDGISRTDLHYHYTRQELVDYCKEEGIPRDGLKREVVNRILQHLQGVDVSKKKKKRKSSTPSKKKKSASSPRKKDKDSESESKSERKEDEKEEERSADSEKGQKKRKKEEDSDSEKEKKKRKTSEKK